MVLLFKSQINRIALSASKNEYIREELIKNQENNILRTASSACRKYVTKSDDEWSLALGEFSRAIDVYSEEKGDFLPFAQMLIKRKLIDHFRSKKNEMHELSTSPSVMEGNAAPYEDTEGVYIKIVEKSRELYDRSLRDEILDVNDILKQYGFRFFDLTECSPKQDKTKSECSKAACYVLEHKELTERLKKSGKLPISEIVTGTGISRKTLERYRKYLIMIIVIRMGNYPRMKEYLGNMGKEALK